MEPTVSSRRFRFFFLEIYIYVFLLVLCVFVTCNWVYARHVCVLFLFYPRLAALV